MKFKILTISIVVFVASLLLYFALLVNSSDTTVSFSTSTKMWNRYILPEGWSFFTKSPRDKELSIYKIDKNQIQPFVKNAFSLKYLFGLNRRSRTVTTDLTIIYADLSKDLTWLDITNFNNEISLSDTINIPSFKYNFKKPALDKGKYLILKKEITPWAYWSKDKNICKNCKIAYLWIE